MQLDRFRLDVGCDPMGEGTVNEGHVAAVDALQPRGEDDMPWYSVWGDVNDGWLNTIRVNEARQVKLDWLHHHRV